MFDCFHVSELLRRLCLTALNVQTVHNQNKQIFKLLSCLNVAVNLFPVASLHFLFELVLCVVTFDCFFNNKFGLILWGQTVCLLRHHTNKLMSLWEFYTNKAYYKIRFYYFIVHFGKIFLSRTVFTIIQHLNTQHWKKTCCKVTKYIYSSI